MTRGTDVTDLPLMYRTPAVAAPGELPDELMISLVKEWDLKYGENPNQPGAIYRFKASTLAEITNTRIAKTGKGGLSLTNSLDIASALGIVKYFSEPGVAVMKHTNPSGVATGERSLRELYVGSRDTDRRSAFGSAVGFNRAVDRETAEELLSTFVEVVAAPDYEEGVLEMLERKADLRVALFSNIDRIPKYVGDDISGLYDIRVMLETGRVGVQRPYLSRIRSVSDLVLDPMVRVKDGEGERRVVVARDPTEQELRDMLVSWRVNLRSKSNGVIFVKDGRTVAVGIGQQERVGAVEQAGVKAYQKAMDREAISYDALYGMLMTIPSGLAEGELADFMAREDRVKRVLNGAVVSSDGFFPKRDSIDLLARMGVTAVIQPGGSKSDAEIIEAANSHGMAMAFTRERCFLH